MKTKYAILLFVLVSTLAQSQSISQYVIGNSGNTISGGSATLSFTLGESVIGEISNGTTLGQGFWQGAIAEITLSNEDFISENETVVYPNPVSNQLNIVFGELTGNNFELFLMDISGRMILHKELSNVQDREILFFNNLSSGHYLLQLVNTESQLSKTFKIIKN